jgi:DNA-binding winged helix-turn-helix (wHTH) protein
MTIHALGPFRLDTKDGLLLRGGEPVTLGRRAIALLRSLVEQPGALLSKDALIEVGWPGRSVEESNLTVQIAALRRILSTTPGGDGWIETMPGRGYRFIGPVIAEAQKGAPEKSTSQRMRVNVQLIDAETGNHLWAERFDKPLADLFDMQDEIVARLANALDAQLAGAEAGRVST